jgi:uncharacterized protein
MAQASREFQIFAKPTGPACNLECHYCYYTSKGGLYPGGSSFRMSDTLLEEYIVQHIEASPGPVINFSWHGGEPTILGLDYFQKIVALQKRHRPSGLLIRNGIQTNGTLLDEDWCHFLATEGFAVGLSLDGPKEMHDRYRVGKDRSPTHEKVMQGYGLLRQFQIPCDILCVVNAQNVQFPTEVYGFFKEIGARAVGFLPLVEPESYIGGVSDRAVPAEAFGLFLCAIFDEWLSRDVGRIDVQIFEETARTALGEEHRLCIFRKTCGDVPVIEHNGDFFSCDHFVDIEHRLGNILETPLVELLESSSQKTFGEDKTTKLPLYCKNCPVLTMCNGGCPKDRFLKTPDGEEGLNYLCAGYKHFFTHCGDFVAGLSALRQKHDQEGITPPVPNEPAT